VSGCRYSFNKRGLPRTIWTTWLKCSHLYLHYIDVQQATEDQFPVWLAKFLAYPPAGFARALPTVRTVQHFFFLAST
jgi:hypothetical protein